MADVIKQIKVDNTVHDIGGSIYKLDEARSSTTSTTEILYIVLYCGTSTELID